MSHATKRRIGRIAAKNNPQRRRQKLKVEAESYFTKRHTESRKLHLPAYAKKQDKERASAEARRSCG